MKYQSFVEPVFLLFQMSLISQITKPAARTPNLYTAHIFYIAQYISQRFCEEIAVAGTYITAPIR
jgi:hypothetical protein